MNRERLTELHKLLLSIPEGKFNINFWARGKDGQGSFTKEEAEAFSLEDCSTAACALGWAASHPPFMEQGLSLVTLHEDERAYSLCPGFEGVDCYEAGAEFFGISYRQSEILFDPLEYELGAEVSPTEVAERVWELLEMDDA